MKLLTISDKHLNEVFVCFWLCFFLISPIVFCSSLEHRIRGQMLLCAPKHQFPLQSRTGLQGYIHTSFKVKITFGSDVLLTTASQTNKQI